LSWTSRFGAGRQSRVPHAVRAHANAPLIGKSSFLHQCVRTEGPGWLAGRPLGELEGLDDEAGHRAQDQPESRYKAGRAMPALQVTISIFADLDRPFPRNDRMLLNVNRQPRRTRAMEKPAKTGQGRPPMELPAENDRLRTIAAELKAEICALKAALEDRGSVSALLLHPRPKRLAGRAEVMRTNRANSCVTTGRPISRCEQF
jgi:hypothetical protein